MGLIQPLFKLYSLSLQNGDTYAIDFLGLLWRLNYMVLLLRSIVVGLFSDFFFKVSIKKRTLSYGIFLWKQVFLCVCFFNDYITFHHTDY